MAKTPAVPEPSEAMLRLRGMFASNVVNDTDDPEVAQMRMVERIFEGETLDDILGGGEAVHAENVLGEPFLFTDVEYRESDDRYKGGIDVFAVAHVTNLRTGEKQVVTTGSVTCCAALLSIKMRNLFPFYGKFEQGNETKSGYTPLQIRQLKPSEVPVSVNVADEDPL